MHFQPFPPKLKRSACCSLLLLCCLTVSHGQQAPSVHLLNPPGIISPGGHFTLFFEVGRRDTSSFNAGLTLPENWQVLFSRKTDAGPSATKYIYTIATLPATRSGSYPITFLLIDAAGGSLEKKVMVEIAKVRKVEIVKLPGQEYVQEGDSLHLNYLLQNLGNHPEKVKLTTSRGMISIKKDSLLLEPMTSLNIKVSLQVPKTESNYWLMSNDLFVSLQDSLTPVNNFSSVPVYSGVFRKRDPYLRFPVEAGIWYTHFNMARNKVSSFQYDFRGRGYLDFKQRHYLDFTVHGPNRMDFPALGTYDQYSFNYSYKNKTEVNLGDYLLAFNNLMEFGRFGRGLRFNQQIGKTGFNLFYLQPRFYPNQKDTFGGRWYYKPKEDLVFALDAISKEVQFNNRWFTSTMAGLSTSYKNQRLMLNTELTLSNALKKTDFGFFNRLFFHHNKLHVSSDLVYAGKNFYGFYHNSWQAVNNATYYLFKKISVGVQSNFSRVNPSFDTYAMNTSPYYTNNSLLINYDLNATHRMVLSYSSEEKEDRQEIKQFDYREKYTRLLYLINAPNVQLWTENRYGMVRNLMATGDEVRLTRSIRSAVQPQVRALSWLWIGGLFEYQRNAKFTTGTDLNSYYFYGANARIQKGNTFNASFSYRNSFAPDELVQRRSYMDLNAELNMKRHKLSMSGGKAFIPGFEPTNQNTLYFTLKYTFKLGLPLVKNKNLGSVIGRISGAAGIKKSGVMVSLGNKKFITDSSGRFHFNDLPFDKYHLGLQLPSPGNGVIAAVRTPLLVELKGKSNYEIDIPLVVSGGIAGKIKLKDTLDYQNPGKLNILVKLFREQESFLTQANDKGEFSFKEIQPGDWHLQATIYGQQNHYEFESPAQQVTIESEKLKDVFFILTRKERKIYFSENTIQLNLKK